MSWVTVPATFGPAWKCFLYHHSCEFTAIRSLVSNHRSTPVKPACICVSPGTVTVRNALSLKLSESAPALTPASNSNEPMRQSLPSRGTSTAAATAPLEACAGFSPIAVNPALKQRVTTASRITSVLCRITSPLLNLLVIACRKMQAAKLTALATRQPPVSLFETPMRTIDSSPARGSQAGVGPRSDFCDGPL